MPIVEELIETDDMPHMLFYGPNGAGKRTFIKCVLNSLFGESAMKIKSEVKEIQATKTTTVDCVLNSSAHHIEVNPSESDKHDRAIVNTLIKETASSRQMDTHTASQKSRPFKVVVIHELDKLSLEAQAGLRRTMEKYMNNCRIIFNCESLSKVIAPLKSRCVQFRIPAPTHEEVIGTLKLIAGEEEFKLPEGLAEKISREARRNMRRAILMM